MLNYWTGCSQPHHCQRATLLATRLTPRKTLLDVKRCVVDLLAGQIQRVPGWCWNMRRRTGDIHNWKELLKTGQNVDSRPNMAHYKGQSGPSNRKILKNKSKYCLWFKMPLKYVGCLNLDYYISWIHSCPRLHPGISRVLLNHQSVWSRLVRPTALCNQA